MRPNINVSNDYNNPHFVSEKIVVKPNKGLSKMKCVQASTKMTDLLPEGVYTKTQLLRIAEESSLGVENPQDFYLKLGKIVANKIGVL